VNVLPASSGSSDRLFSAFRLCASCCFTIWSVRRRTSFNDFASFDFMPFGPCIHLNFFTTHLCPCGHARVVARSDSPAPIPQPGSEGQRPLASCAEAGWAPAAGQRNGRRIRPPYATLVLVQPSEQPDQQDDWYWNPEQPKQQSATHLRSPSRQAPKGNATELSRFRFQTRCRHRHSRELECYPPRLGS
jgi:hypothetical protein